MNREILFKAKRKDNGEWVEGFVFEFKNKFYITEMAQTFMTAYYTEKSVVDFNMRAYEIDPETLCQYTGLTDKNGKKIFEGDIVRDGENYGEVKFGLYESDWQIDKYNQGFFVTFPKEYLFRRELGFWRNKIVVVGNIFDNANLLEVE